MMDHGLFRVKEGWCAAAWTVKGLCALSLPQATHGKALRQLASELPPLKGDPWDRPLRKVPKDLQRKVLAVLSGRSPGGILLDLFFLTPFQRKVLSATCRVPAGQTRSYQWVARQAGSPRGYRAAGSALNRNPVPLLVPCHRITASGNRLGGYGGGIDWKIRLLEREGVRVEARSGKGYRVVHP